MLSHRQSIDDINNKLDTDMIPIIFEEDDKTELTQLLIGLDNTQKLKLAQLDMFVACLLNVAKSSISHVINYLKMYNKLLKDLITSPFSELRLLHDVREFWQRSPLVYILFYFLKQLLFIHTIYI